MSVYTALTKGGSSYTPMFVQTIKQSDCIGCGRCFKACGQGVLLLIGVTEDGEYVDAFDDEAEKKIMSIQNDASCIGCQACGRTCPKDLYTFEEMAIAS